MHPNNQRRIDYALGIAAAAFLAATIAGAIVEFMQPLPDPPEQSVPSPPNDEQSKPAGFPSGPDQTAANFRDQAATGFYSADGLSIAWAGTTSAGTNPETVLDALTHRLEWEQSTDLASDDKARALAHLLQARAALAGRPTETEDGPIID